MSRRLAAFVALWPTLALAQGNDEAYSKKIREYTTDPMFLTELVDHLPASASVPTPQKSLGYVVGTPEKLTYAKDVHDYFRQIEKASPRVKVLTMGTTEENREQILVLISDEANLQKLDRLKEITARLGDPRKTTDAEARSLISEGKTLYWATGAMHSPETGSPFTPVLEVDGRERMVDVYRYRKANPKRTPPSLLYWGKYVAHDNNRDGMGLALKQSQHVIKTFLDYHPPAA